jgi:Cof subfamily protein (haloacid dehalogenase superfamily)
MDIECCVCDIDGTLLTSARDLNAATIQAIGQLRERNIRVILATGRSDLFVKDLVERLGLSGPVISCNGGMIRQNSTGEVLFSKHLPAVTAGAIAGYCLEKKYDVVAYTADCLYFRKDSERIHFFRQYNAKVRPAFRIPMREMAEPEDVPLGKVIKFFLGNLEEQQIAGLLEIYRTAEVTMVSSESKALDIMAKDISKGAALAFLAKRLNINLAKTAVFGDHYNDISMLEVAGLSIAVANAPAAVQQAAMHVTLSNDADGVAHAIHKYILAAPICSTAG